MHTLTEICHTIDKLLLKEHQLKALNEMKNGCILKGSVGSGKSFTSLAYYYKQNGGTIYNSYKVGFQKLKTQPKDLYIITTARKRDDGEWENELINIGLSTNPKFNMYTNKVVIDSWNNIKKYETVNNSFFIFDEQRVSGGGVWSNTFIKISRKNDWILLSATPGDTWSDYIPVFIANGFYKNKTDFARKHVIYSRYTTYPKIERYINTGLLNKYRNSIQINMDYIHHVEKHNIDIIVGFDEDDYRLITQTRWDIFKNKPIENASSLCYSLRKLVNMHYTRQEAIINILKDHPTAIIFYSYDYELEILRKLFMDCNYKFSEWNGHKHEPIPTGDAWVYLVEYIAGCEGWNCITTNCIIFYSQNYSYRIMQQACGRIDRMNTPYNDLYYFYLKSKSKIDMAITKAIVRKKKFNESKFAGF